MVCSSETLNTPPLWYYQRRLPLTWKQRTASPPTLREQWASTARLRTKATCECGLLSFLCSGVEILTKYKCTLVLFSLHFVLKVFWEREQLLPGTVVPESVDELQPCGGGWGARETGNVRGWGCSLWDRLHHWWRFSHWSTHIWDGRVSFHQEYFLIRNTS